MIQKASYLRSIFDKFISMGCEGDLSVTSCRITKFTNVIVLVSMLMGLSIYTKLGQFGIPDQYIYTYYVFLALCPLVFLFNSQHYLFLARLTLLSLIIVATFNANLVFGKTFNGGFMLFVALFYSILAFSRQPIYIRLFLFLCVYVWFSIYDYLYYYQIFPLTGFQSRDFPLSVLLSDSIAVPVVIAVLVWMEKSMANQYEDSLKSALDEVSLQRQKVKLIFDNIDLGIALLNPDLSCDSEHSAHLKDIIEHQSPAGENIFELVFNKSDMSMEERANLKNVLDNCLGEDILNWDLNQDHLIKNMIVVTGSGEKHLELSWAPILEKGQVSQVVLSLTDKSKELLALKMLEDSKKREEDSAHILSLILQFGVDEFADFLSRLDKVIVAIKNHPVEIKISREIHTLKGEARLFGVNELSANLHELESVLHDSPLSQSKLATIVKSIFAWKENAAKLMEKIFNNEAASLAQWSLLSYIARLQPGLLKSVQSYGLELKSFNVHESMTNYPPKYQNIVQAFLLHGLQNAIDHGFHLAKIHRPIQLTVSSESRGERLTVTIRDNGAGVNLDKIREKLGPDSADVTETDLYHSLFIENFSTANQISQSSGRGLGLAEVKGLVHQYGGDVSIYNNLEGNGASLHLELPI
jgi:HPt (histidine-containing phosphotransfer) domain-containing protein